MQDIRIAAAIFQAPVSRIRENLEKMESFVADARRRHAQIICFPEMNITGYSTRAENFAEIDPSIDRILDTVVGMASRYQMGILCGFAETGENGRFFAAHAFADPDGTVGIYRKLHLAPPEKQLFTPAEKIPVFRAFGKTFGIQLCYDAHFPELSTYMAGQGVDILFIPHASPRGTPLEKYNSWMRHLPARAYDNSIFVVACNQTGNNGAGLDFPGLAVVLDPSGELIEKDVHGREGMLVATLQADLLKRVRGHRMRYFFPNRREDLFPL